MWSKIELRQIEDIQNMSILEIVVLYMMLKISASKHEDDDV